MEFRRATPDDAELILRLWQNSDATMTTTDEVEYLRRVTENPAVVFLIALVDGEIVGSLLGTFDGWSTVLERTQQFLAKIPKTSALGRKPSALVTS
jgi:hypothetical protein